MYLETLRPGSSTPRALPVGIIRHIFLLVILTHVMGHLNRQAFQPKKWAIILPIRFFLCMHSTDDNHQQCELLAGVL